MKGTFTPTNIMDYSEEFFLDESNIDYLVESITKQKYKMICINDSISIKNFEQLKNQVIGAFETILMSKSEYER